MSKFERGTIVWGLGDFVMVLVTLMLWIPLKLAFYGGQNPWRCSACGSRPGKSC